MSRKRLHYKFSKPTHQRDKFSKPTHQRATKRPQETADAMVEVFRYPDGSMSVLPYRAGPKLINFDAQYHAKALDREWFRSHPHRTHRIRKAVEGEVLNMTANTYVIVRQLKPGYRERASFEPLGPLPEGDAPEHIAHAWFDLIKEFPGRTILGDELAARMRAYETGWSTEKTRGGSPRTVH